MFLQTSKLNFNNPVRAEHWRNGKLLEVYETFNGVTDEGIEDLLDTYFDSGIQITTWYMGLIDNSGFSALADADTMASHAGWSESTAYSEATRPQWNPDAAASRASTNSTTIDFTINATVTIKGIFLVSNSTKSGTTGVLFATAAFSSTVPLVSADVLKVTYTVSG